MDTDLVTWTFGGDVQDVDKPILIDPSQPHRSLSWKQLRLEVRSLVAGLHANGVQIGDCVLVNAFNDILYYAIYLGIIGAGAIFTGTNPSYTVPELVHHFRLTKPKVIIAETSTLENTVIAAAEVGIAREKVFVLDLESNAQVDQSPRSWRALLEHGEEDWVTGMNSRTTAAHYASTSGTSGLPKAAVLSHAYHISQAERRVDDAVAAPYTIRRLATLPPFHVFATPIIPSSIRLGIETYVMQRFEMGSFLSHVSKFEISETYLVPPVIVAMAQSPAATREKLCSLRQIWFGGASLKYQNQLPLYERLDPNARIQPVWGMTEAGWISAGNLSTRTEDDSVGKPLHGYSITVVDDQGNKVERGLIGELVVKCPAPMLGYLENDEATREALTDEQSVRTGDVGYLSADGRVYMVDRKKDLIKVRGWSVSPAEIEGVLLQHPGIKDAAVIGVELPDSKGEMPRAYVVQSPGSRLDESDIRTFAASRLASYKIPAEFVWTDSIPKNPTGKILRRVLKIRPETEKVLSGSTAGQVAWGVRGWLMVILGLVAGSSWYLFLHRSPR